MDKLVLRDQVPLNDNGDNMIKKHRNKGRCSSRGENKGWKMNSMNETSAVQETNQRLGRHMIWNLALM